MFEWSDLLTILVLIVLEGLLSGDNALVLAVIVMPLPEEQQRRALRYGIIGAFVLRTIATFLAVCLVQVKWVSLIGGLYLLWLPFNSETWQALVNNTSASAGKGIFSLAAAVEASRAGGIISG